MFYAVRGGRVVTLIVFFAFRAAWARCRTVLGQTKTPTAKTCCRGQSQRLCGATPLDTASLPRPLIDCQHSQASYASFTSSATRHLSPRPSGAHIIGFGPCRHHTIADSLSVRLPFSSRQRFVKLSLSYHRIFALSTDFDPLSQFFVLRGASTCATRTPSCARTRMYALQYCRHPPASHPHRPAARCDHHRTPSNASHARQHILSRDPPAATRRCAFGDYS